MLLHRHRAIFCCAFGVARLNSRGVGLFEKPCFSTGTYDCLLKLSVSIKWKGGGGGGVVSSWV